MKMTKKAQTNTLSNLQTVVMAIVGIGVILAIGLFILAEISTSVTEETYGTTNATNSKTVAMLNASVYQNIDFGDDTALTVLYNATSNRSYQFQVNQTQIPSLNLIYLRYKGWNFSGTYFTSLINTSDIVVYNTSAGQAGQITGGQGRNFTVINVSGNVIIVNVTNTSFSSANLTVLYNVSVYTTADFADTYLCYIDSDCPLITTVDGGYGGNYEVKFHTPSYTVGTELNGINLTLTYKNTTRTLGTGSTAASSATNEMINKLGSAPTWIGLLIVVIFASAILAYFYYRQ